MHTISPVCKLWNIVSVYRGVTCPRLAPLYWNQLCRHRLQMTVVVLSRCFRFVLTLQLLNCLFWHDVLLYHFNYHMLIRIPMHSCGDLCSCLFNNVSVIYFSRCCFYNVVFSLSLQVTMANRDAAEKACKDPNPIIDGRKANVNLAYLGAKPRGKYTRCTGAHSTIWPKNNMWASGNYLKIKTN